MKLKIECYLEGIKIPVKKVTIMQRMNQPATAMIDIQYVNGCEMIYPTTTVMLFYQDDRGVDFPPYKIMFFGYVTMVKPIVNAQERKCEIQAISMIGHLNTMPSKFLWYLTSYNYKEFLEDYAFYGLPVKVDGKDNVIKEWYKTSFRYTSVDSGNIEEVKLRPQETKARAATAPSMEITSLYGDVRGNTEHKGVDFACKENTKLYAPASGTVYRVTKNKNAAEGVMVSVSVGQYRYIYMHLNDVTVSEGSAVNKGELIAYSGNTGESDGPHLHLEIKKGDQNVNPVSPAVIEASKIDYRDIFIPNRDAKIDGVSFGQYIMSFLGMMNTADGDMMYYGNLDALYMISSSAVAVDYGDMFKRIWAAAYKSSFATRSYEQISRFRMTTLYDLVNNLYEIGYIMASTSYPSDGETFVIFSQIPHNQRVPRFNYVRVEQDDTMTATVAAMPVTALKYKYKNTQGKSIISETWPPGCMDGKKFTATSNEKKYGVSRDARDKEYFFNAYLADAHNNDSGAGDYFKMVAAYEYEMEQTRGNSASAVKNGFYPEYVVGFPGIIYDGMTGKTIYGIVDSITHIISPSQGYSATSVSLTCAKSVTSEQAINSPGMVNPVGGIDYGKNQKSLNNYLFYEGKKEDNLLTEGYESISGDEYLDYIRRPIGTAQEFLRKLYGDIRYMHPPYHNEKEGVLVLQSKEDLAMGYTPEITFEDRFKKKIIIGDSAKKTSMGDGLTQSRYVVMYIKERYDIIRKIKAAMSPVVEEV